MAEKSKEDQGVASRVVAAQVIGGVLDNAQNLDDALDHFFAKSRLPEQDRKLVHAICGFVFRHLPEIDDAVHRVTTQKRDPKPKILFHLLRVGVAQILYMDVAPHAAVHATVSAAVSLKLVRQKSFVNAVLRSVQREREALLARTVLPLRRLPSWLEDSWVAHYGQTRAEELAVAVMQEAPVDVTLNASQAPLEWAQKLEGEPLTPWSIRVPDKGGHITSWPGFTDGSWWVQDVAASLPINMLGDITDKSVLDIGAAPGGKTLQLAALGAKVTALDISGSRMSRVTENLQRVKSRHDVKTVVADARTWRPGAPFHVVVLDAPCSSTGTLRRHPELPWIRGENEVMTLGVIQRDLLRHASEMITPDGILMYCTCSMQPEEGESQVEAFLLEHKDFKEIKEIPDAVRPFVVPGINGTGFRTFPTLLADKGGMDGFFIALLQRQ